MKTVDATPGKYQVVRSVNGCTVSQTLDDGQVVTDAVPAGESTAVFAFTSRIEVDDDSAVVREVFKLAPQQQFTLLGVLGGGGDEGLLKYAKCETYADMVAVNPDFANDLTSDGEWVYPLPNLKYLNQYHENQTLWGYGFWKENKALKKWSVELPAVTEAGSGFALSAIEVFDGGFPALACPTYRFYANKIEAEGQRIFIGATKLRYFRGDLSKAQRLNMAFQGCTSLTEFHATLDSLCTAANAFSDCQLDKASALRVLNSLPNKEYVDSVYTDLSVARQELTLGMHTDLQQDEEVLSALAAAAENGWTVAKQWNGKSSAAAFALRTPPPPPVYAKVDAQQGLDWCHGVTSPDGRGPEELGYTLFESVEAAREYFGLPEKTLTETE